MSRFTFPAILLMFGLVGDAQARIGRSFTPIYDAGELQFTSEAVDAPSLRTLSLPQAAKRTTATTSSRITRRRNAPPQGWWLPPYRHLTRAIGLVDPPCASF